jgi:peptidoglycan/LPS O-acetylase OafA/YrhL
VKLIPPARRPAALTVATSTPTRIADRVARHRKLGQIDGLTGVRGLAALWVAFLHGRTAAPLDDLPFGALGRLIGHGWLGVDLFFVLSGFIISYVHASDFTRVSWHAVKRFLALRMARIYPAHAVATLVLAPMLLVGMVLLGYAPRDHTFSLLRLGYSLTLLNGWGIPGSVGWNVPSWSVSSEWFAYLLFPLIAVVLLRVGSRVANAGIAVATCLITVSLAVWLTGATRYMLGERFTLIRVSSEFFIGCCLLGIYRKSTPSRAYDWPALGGALAVILLGLLSPPPFWDFLFIVLFAATILGLSLATGPATLVFGHPVLIYLGRVSYSLYLMHAIVLIVVHQVARRLFPTGGLVAAGIAWLIYLAAAIGAAHLLFTTVEEPARMWARRRLDPNLVARPLGT